MATPKTFREEECCNVYWKIKNFSYFRETIFSPKFNFQENYRYCLGLHRLFPKVECYCYSKSDPGYDFEFKTMQISFLTCDGSPEESYTGEPRVSLKVTDDIIFGNRRSSLLPSDTLTVRLRWQTDGVRGTFFICSQIPVKRLNFLWTFESVDASPCSREKFIEYSDRYGSIKVNLQSKSGFNYIKDFNIKIYKKGGGKCYCVLKASLQDLDGHSFDEVSEEFPFGHGLDLDGKSINKASEEFFGFRRDEDVREFPSIFKKNKWIAWENVLLKENKLSLKCFFSISLGTVPDGTADISYFEYAAPLLKQSDQLSMTFQEKKVPGSVSELQADLKNLLQDGTLTDTKLQIGTQEIQVHRSILSARSPVFKDMFTKDMKEKNNSVVIEDLDIETIRRLLLYMYTNTIHPDHLENIEKLHIAASKYEVLSLKEKCASFLKTNLSVSNVSETLVLADMHKDEELKSIVLDFISKFDYAVFHSEEWKELGRKNSSLVIQVMTEICCRKRC